MERSDNAIAGPEPNTLTCRGCGAKLRLRLPLPVEVFVNLVRAFDDLHAYCDRGVFAPEPEGTIHEEDVRYSY